MNNKYLSAILALLIVVIFNSFISPTSSELENKKSQLSSLETELQELNLIDIDESSVSLSSLDKEILDNAIPQGINQDKFILLLNDILNSNGVFDSSGFNFQRQAADTQNQIKAMQSTISGKINLNNLPNLLKDLEANNRFIILKNFSSSIEKIEDTEIANFSISLEVFFS